MGRMIVLEGLDGSGKTTQSEWLIRRLRSSGKTVHPLSFPAYENESSSLVRMYLGGRMGDDPDGVSPYGASLFYAADRYITFLTEWRSAWQDPDTWIVATRYTTANAYHQLAKLPPEEWDGFLAWLFDLEYGKLGLPKPDEVILLEMPAVLSSRQVEKRAGETGQTRDIHELDADYQERCRRAAVYAADKLGWKRILCTDGSGALLPREAVADRIAEALGL